MNDQNTEKSAPNGRSFDSQFRVTIEFHANSTEDSALINALQLLKAALLFRIPMNGKKDKATL